MLSMTCIKNSLLPVLLVCLFASDGLTQTMVDPSRFQAPQQAVYTLDDGDTLGVFVEGVLGESNSMPPVHQPAAGSTLPPAMGYPTLVLHDGTIRLPFADPISVRGLTVSQVESLLKKTYREGETPVITDRSRVIVSLIRKRTVNVMVIRGDQSQARSAPRFMRQNSNPVSTRSDGSGQIFNLNLPAGESDLLSAMMESGGLPGVNAEDQMQILRRAHAFRQRNTPFPRAGENSQQTYAQSVPIRANYSGQVSPFPRSDARLGDGDVVSIAAKPTEVFYIGGQLGGGEFAIPRDRPLSVMDAISQVGGVPQPRRGVAAVPLQEPRRLTLLRKQGGHQVSYQFDLTGGFSQQASQIRVRSGDYLILDHTPAQRVQNVGIGVFNTWGVRQLLGN